MVEHGLEPALYLAGAGQDLAIFDHVRGLQWAQVGPDALGGQVGYGGDALDDRAHGRGTSLGRDRVLGRGVRAYRLQAL